MRSEEAVAIRDQRQEQAVPFFFKQWDVPYKKRAGRILDGPVRDEYPAARVRTVTR